MQPILEETLTRKESRDPNKGARAGRAGSVYIIHFDTAFHHARHYAGWTKGDVDGRMIRHFNGSGARIMRAVTGEGIPWRVVRVFRNADRYFERWLKNQHRTGDFCPVCSNPPRMVRSDG